MSSDSAKARDHRINPRSLRCGDAPSPVDSRTLTGDGVDLIEHYNRVFDEQFGPGWRERSLVPEGGEDPEGDRKAKQLTKWPISGGEKI